MSKVDGIKIQEKTTFNDVMTYRTKAQQRAFTIFDYNDDQIMQENEARNFNLFDIKLIEDTDKNQETLVLKNNKHNKNKFNLSLTYSVDDLAKLKKAKMFDFDYVDRGDKPRVSLSTSTHSCSLMAKFDLSSDNLTVEAMNGGDYILARNLNKLKIKKANTEGIFADNTRNVEICNTSFDGRTTDLIVSHNTNVGIMDNKSKVRIIRF